MELGIFSFLFKAKMDEVFKIQLIFMNTVFWWGPLWLWNKNFKIQKDTEFSIDSALKEFKNLWQIWINEDFSTL